MSPEPFCKQNSNQTEKKVLAYLLEKQKFQNRAS